MDSINLKYNIKHEGKLALFLYSLTIIEIFRIKSRYKHIEKSVNFYYFAIRYSAIL